MLELAKEIVGGRRLTREEDCSFLLEADINELCEGADYIRKNLCGTRADLCAIINGKSGACSENCKFCSQSAHHHTACQAEILLMKKPFYPAAAKHGSRG